MRQNSASIVSYRDFFLCSFLLNPFSNGACTIRIEVYEGSYAGFSTVCKLYILRVRFKRCRHPAKVVIFFVLLSLRAMK